MIGILIRKQKNEPHIIIDSNGKYYGISPSLAIANEMARGLIDSGNEADSIFIYKVKKTVKIEREEQTKLSDLI